MADSTLVQFSLAVTTLVGAAAVLIPDTTTPTYVYNDSARTVTSVVYSDRARTSPITQPVLPNAQGLVSFYVRPNAVYYTTSGAVQNEFAVQIGRFDVTEYGALGMKNNSDSRTLTVATTLNSAVVTGNAQTTDIGAYVLVRNAGGAFIANSQMAQGGYPEIGQAPHLRAVVSSVVVGVSWTLSIVAGSTFAATTMYLSHHDDTAAFVAWAAAIQANGGGKAVVPADVYFIVLPIINVIETAIVNGFAECQFTGLNGLEIDAGSAIIVDMQSSYVDTQGTPYGPGSAFLEIDSCTNVTINIGCLVTQFCVFTESGPDWIRVQGACRNVRIYGERQGGIYGSRITSLARSAWASGESPNNIFVDTTNIGLEYPIVVEGKNPRGVVANLINNGCFRDFYIQAGSGHRIYCESRGNRGNALLSIDATASLPTTTILEDVQVVYRTEVRGDAISGVQGIDTPLVITFKGSGTLQYSGVGPVLGPGTMRNIRVYLDIRQMVVGDFLSTPLNCLTISKSAPDLSISNDTAGRGHILDGLDISGRIQMTPPDGITYPAYTSSTYAQLINVLGAFANPDKVSNVRIHDLEIITVNGANGSLAQQSVIDFGNALQDVAVCDHVTAGALLTLGATGSPGYWVIQNCGAAPNIQTNKGMGYYVGTGSPAGVTTANIGSTFNRLDGGAATSLYVKETGANTTAGWVAK